MKTIFLCCCPCPASFPTALSALELYIAVELKHPRMALKQEESSICRLVFQALSFLFSTRWLICLRILLLLFGCLYFTAKGRWMPCAASSVHSRSILGWEDCAAWIDGCISCQKLSLYAELGISVWKSKYKVKLFEPWSWVAIRCIWHKVYILIGTLLQRRSGLIYLCILMNERMHIVTWNPIHCTNSTGIYTLKSELCITNGMSMKDVEEHLSKDTYSLFLLQSQLPFQSSHLTCIMSGARCWHCDIVILILKNHF